MICCCSLAGTKACENCNNRTIITERTIDIFPNNYKPSINYIDFLQKTGYWIEEPNENANNRLEWRCSNCNEYADWTYDYCPNCGAKMENI